MPATAVTRPPRYGPILRQRNAAPRLVRCWPLIDGWVTAATTTTSARRRERLMNRYVRDVAECVLLRPPSHLGRYVPAGQMPVEVVPRLVVDDDNSVLRKNKIRRLSAHAASRSKRPRNGLGRNILTS